MHASRPSAPKTGPFCRPSSSPRAHLKTKGRGAVAPGHAQPDAIALPREPHVPRAVLHDLVAFGGLPQPAADGLDGLCGARRVAEGHGLQRLAGHVEVAAAALDAPVQPAGLTSGRVGACSEGMDGLYDGHEVGFQWFSTETKWKTNENR